MTVSLRCRLAAVATSAVVHLAVAAALVWTNAGQTPDADASSREVGVTLAMFHDASPPGGAPSEPAAAPAPVAPTTPEPAREPEPEPEQPVVAESQPLPDLAPPPEPDPAPVQEPPPPSPLPELAAEPPPPKPQPSKPQPSKPKPPPKPKVKPKATPTPDVAVVKAGPPRVQPVSVPAAPSGTPAAASGGGHVGGASTAAAIEGDYLRGLQQAIARNRFYPPGARREDVTGVVTVAFTIQSDGRLGDIRVAKGSGFEVLDQAALETLRRLGSYRPIPPGIGRARWPVRVPIVFDLR